MLSGKLPGKPSRLSSIKHRHLLALTQRTTLLDDIATTRALVDIDSLLRAADAGPPQHAGDLGSA